MKRNLRLFVTVVYAVLSLLVPIFVGWCQQQSFATGGPRTGVRALTVRVVGETLDRIGGLATAKRELRRHVVLPLRHPSLFYAPNGGAAMRPPAGILLHGPPGTGKTMLARAVACESGATLLALHAATLESKWYGETPRLLAECFRLARGELAPCILFFDELDALGRARRDDDQACVYSLKCELLRNMDGIDGGVATTATLVLACTNCPTALDPALRRRFARTIEVPTPDTPARADILARTVGSDECTGAVLRRVARATPGATGASLRDLAGVARRIRADEVDLEREISEGRIRTPEHLAAAVHGLRWEHWAQALKLSGFGAGAALREGTADGS